MKLDLLAAALALCQLNTQAGTLPPVAASANMYLDNDGNVIKGVSTYGFLAVGVPGTAGN
jgi:gamma-glutamyltranspeptidase